ncbi:MAG: endonuclease/exonuclease/phosphatase family protein [Proteobacteria bacterium]|nr:endonuclease/exonuclease/phosphatase family protein [Pseudomonadota bacterium]MCP4917643.1 endonuclease/exonuclease/phosphatase family protein [Pseudomonadota bacterium]
MTPQSARFGVLRALALLGALAGISLICVAVAGVADRALPTLLLLVAEPLLWIGLVALCIHAALAQRVDPFVLGLSSLLALGLAVRQDRPLEQPPGAPEEASPTVRHCASQSGLPTRPLRVATWNASQHPDRVAAVDAILELDADLVVVQEVDEDFVLDLAARVQDQLGDGGLAEGPDGAAATDADAPAVAEGLFVHAEGTWGHGIVVRDGFFGVCGADQHDAFGISLPTAGDREALASLTFPVIGETVLPVVSLHLDRPGALSELGRWPHLLEESSARIAGFADALGAPGLLVVGDTNTHGTFRGFHGRMRDAGLLAVPARATWPGNLAGFPTLPLYQLDRIWHGVAWEFDSVEAIRMPSDHLAVVAELSPRELDPLR